MEIIARYALNLFYSLRDICMGKILWRELKRQFVFIGYESLPLILILNSVSSMIISINTANEFMKFGGRELIGAAITLSNLKEMTPIFIAFAIGARCGTAITAEIASMKINEQVDVLKVLGIKEVFYLISPKILAALSLGALILPLTSIVSSLAGMVMSNLTVGLEYSDFLDSALRYTRIKDLIDPFIKIEIFLIYIILTSCTFALLAKNNSREVGDLTAKSSTYTLIGILIINTILTTILYG